MRSQRIAAVVVFGRDKRVLMFQSLLAALRGSVGSSCVARRHSWLLLPVLAISYSPLASAVGLGQITVHSALNQPLEAEIALVQAQGLGEGELSVGLATAGEFKQAGVERLPFLEDLRFIPVLQGERRVIRVVSSKPVNEPFLDFLLQVNQANGRQLREYTLLIDPPGSPEITPAPAPIGELAKPGPAMATQAPPAAAKAADLMAGQLAQAMQASQQLQNQVQELQGTLRLRDEQLALQQQQLLALQRQLAEVQRKPAANPVPAPAAAPAQPTAVSPSRPAEQAPETAGSNPWLMVAALLLTALLILLVVRRRRQSAGLPGRQVPAEPRPTQTLASAVAAVAAQEPFRSAAAAVPVPPMPMVEERLADHEPSIDVDWDLIAPGEPSNTSAPAAAVPAPFNADSIVWRLEEPDEPGSSAQAEAETETQKVWPRLR